MAAKPTLPNLHNARAVAEAYVAAYQARDSRAYLALFSRDADYLDFAVQIHAKVSQLKDELAASFQREGFRFSIHTFFVSEDGQSVAMQGTYTDSTRTGEPASVPMACFLRIDRDKITREALYYDGSLFKRHLHAAW